MRAFYKTHRQTKSKKGMEVVFLVCRIESFLRGAGSLCGSLGHVESLQNFPRENPTKKGKKMEQNTITIEHDDCGGSIEIDFQTNVANYESFCEKCNKDVFVTVHFDIREIREYGDER